MSLVGGARLASTACQALTLLLVARAVAPAEFAVFAAVLGAMTGVGILADGGATYAIGRHHTSANGTRHILRAGRILSLSTLALSVPALIAVAVVADSAIVLSCLPLAVWVPLERQLEVYSAYLMAVHSESAVAGAYVLRRLPTLLAVLGVLAVGQAELGGVTAVTWAYSMTMTVTSGLAVVILTPPVRRAIARSGAEPDRGLLPRRPTRATWQMLLPFWAAIAGQGLRQLDVAALTVSAGAVAAGAFAPASRLVPALLLIPGTYTQLLLSRLSASGSRLEARSLVIVTVGSLLVFVPLSASAAFWVPAVLGAAYTGAVDVIQIVVAGLVFAALSGYFASGLHASDRSGRVAAAVWTGTGSTIVLIAVLGRPYGSVGAAWATAAGYVLQCGLMAVLYLRRTSHHPKHAKHRVGSRWDTSEVQ